ncbi:MAG: shikimate dehydrogenase [Gammaproteobacteria bacterium]|nr:shikimate dehydrogenase [Gammaproteobacteria bacterium]
MIRLAVFGQPITQSLSPRIHRLFAEQFGLAIDYRAVEANADTFRDRVSALAEQGGLGCNVTLPLKREAWRLAANRSLDADRAEAVNTLLFREDGWFGDNTDGGGLVDDLENGLGTGVRGARICLLGAGGAARGVLAALLKRGADRIVIANRSADKALQLARKHADLGPVIGIGMDALPDAAPFDLAINATSLGHHGRAPELPAHLLDDDGLCYDMNYGTAAEPLKDFCRSRGIRYRDGLGMLVGQAALSFRLWTGKAPATAPVLAAIRSTPAGRD